MKRSRFTEAQILGFLKEVEAERTVRELFREQGFTEQTFYRWQSKFGGLEVNEAKRLKELEEENRKLKQVVAELTLDNGALKAVVSKKMLTPWRCCGKR